MDALTTVIGRLFKRKSGTNICYEKAISYSRERVQVLESPIFMMNEMGSLYMQAS